MNIPRVTKGKRLLLALSGGVDSMVMLDLLLKENRYELAAVTVNHNIRPEGAADAEFTVKHCNDYGIKCFYESIDVPEYAEKNGLSIETAARILRHAAINKHAEGFDFVCFAHHADDQAETVLMHMLRGCGTDGLNGMSVQSERIFRPLLRLTKAEIRRYAEENGISFVEDSTNSDTDYKRNYVRHKVIPILNECYGGASRAICSLAERTSTDSDYLKSVANDLPLYADFGEGFRLLTDKYSENTAASVKVDAKTLASLHKAISVRVVMRMLKAVGASVDTEQKHIDSVITLASNTGGKRLNLHSGITAVISFGALILTRENEERRSIPDEIPFKKLLSGSICLGEYEIQLLKSKESPSCSELKLLRADVSAIPDDAVIRTRREGDRFKKFGGASKKLKDFFIERKIEQKLRNEIPVIASGNTVYAVCGIEIGEALRITDKTLTNNTFCILTTTRRTKK